MMPAERRSAKLPRRRDEETRNLILEAAPFALLLVERSGRIEFANSRTKDIFGYERHELVGRLVEILMPERYRADHEGFRRDFFRWPVARPMGQGRDLYGLKKDGTEVPLEISLTPLKAHGEDRVLVSVLDISMRKRSEEELRLALSRAQSASKALETKTREAEFLSQFGKRLSQSISVQEICQIMKDAIVPSLADWFFLAVFDRQHTLRLNCVAHADPAKQHLVKKLETCTPDPESPEGVMKVLRTRQAVLISEITPEMLEFRPGHWPVFATKDPGHLALIRELGAKSYMALPLVVRGDPTGALMFVSGTSSHRYDGDRELLQEVVHRTALMLDNSILFEEAQRAVRVREDFISVASHELRTPLTALKMQLDLLGRALEKERPGGPPVDHLRSLIAGSGREIDRFSKLVETLLDVSRIGSGKLALKPEQVRLSDHVRSIIEGYERDLREAGCRVDLRLSPEASGQWDPVRIGQIISNLVSNALKYGRGQPIEVLTEVEGEYVRLVVRDHGPGISKKDQTRIFERFERAVDARRYSGLGLGLYVTRELVEAHGGRIWVESEPEKGSAFFVELPARARTQAGCRW